jgi:hypothetical protein
MGSQPWPDQLRSELGRQGLPTAYINRLLEELADHALDSQTENPSMEAQQAYAQLGTTNQLAAAARREFTRRTLAGRYPILAFIVGPVLLAPVLLVSMTFALCILLGVIDYTLELAGIKPPESGDSDPWIEYWVTTCFNGFVRFLPFALAAWLYCRWGKRCEMRRWAIASCCIIAVIAGFFVSKSVPATASQPGLWIVGLGFRANLRQLIQFLVPLAIAAWFFLRLPINIAPAFRQSSPLTP